MKKRLFIFLLAALAILPGCERRPLEYDSPNQSINLRLNLRLNVLINGMEETLPEPEMMRVMFFNPESNELYTECYLPAGGGRVSLPPGRYKLLAYNFDTESTLLRNDRNFFSIEAYTNDISSAMKANMLNSIRYAKSANTKSDSEGGLWDEAIQKVIDNPIIYEPDHLFVSRETIEVRDETGEQVIEASAETIIETWQISVRIKGAQYISSARALLTGQIASNFIGFPKEEGKTDTDATLMFDMNPGSDSAENDIITTQFNTFGKNPSVDSRLFLTIIIKNIAGDILEWHRDITDEYFSEDANKDQRIHIEDEIIVPEPEGGGGGGGGFQPGVSDWEQEDIPINI